MLAAWVSSFACPWLSSLTSCTSLQGGREMIKRKRGRQRRERGGREGERRPRCRRMLTNSNTDVKTQKAQIHARHTPPLGRETNKAAFMKCLPSTKCSQTYWSIQLWCPMSSIALPYSPTVKYISLNNYTNKHTVASWTANNTTQCLQQLYESEYEVAKQTSRIITKINISSCVGKKSAADDPA